MIKTWYKEIDCVGLKDWWFFVVFLKRDEFSKKLDLFPYVMKHGKSDEKMVEAVKTLTDLRERAHKIDEAITDLWSK